MWERAIVPGYMNMEKWIVINYINIEEGRGGSDWLYTFWKIAIVETSRSLVISWHIEDN